MSSSNSNAAARRRRAGPSVPPPMTSLAARASQQQVQNQQRIIQNQTQPQTQQMSPTNQSSTQQPPRPVLTPAQMLIAHENRITELEKAIPEIMQNFVMNEDENVQLAVSDTNANNIDTDEIMNTINTQVSGKLETVEAKNVMLMKRVEQLEEQLGSLMKSFNILRDFATETNVLVMKVFNSENMVMTTNEEEENVPIDSEKPTFSNINTVKESDIQDMTNTDEMDPVD